MPASGVVWLSRTGATAVEPSRAIDACRGTSTQLPGTEQRLLRLGKEKKRKVDAIEREGVMELTEGYISTTTIDTPGLEADHVHALNVVHCSVTHTCCRLQHVQSRRRRPVVHLNQLKALMPAPTPPVRSLTPTLLVARQRRLPTNNSTAVHQCLAPTCAATTVPPLPAPGPSQLPLPPHLSRHRPGVTTSHPSPGVSVLHFSGEALATPTP